MAWVFKAKHFRLFSTISYLMPETIFWRELFGFKRGKREWLFRGMCAKEGCTCCGQPARHVWIPMGHLVAYLFIAWPPKVSVLHSDGKDAGFPVRVKDIFGFLIIGLVAYLEILSSAEEIWTRWTEDKLHIEQLPNILGKKKKEQDIWWFLMTFYKLPIEKIKWKPRRAWATFNKICGKSWPLGSTII